MNAAVEDSLAGVSTVKKENVFFGLEDTLCTDPVYTEQDIDGENKIQNSIYAYCVKQLSCFVCHIAFNNVVSFHHHHLKHVKQPSIILRRIQIDFERIHSGKVLKRRPTSRGLKKKVKSHSPLKLTLKKLTNAAKEPAFEVVNWKDQLKPNNHHIGTRNLFKMAEEEVKVQPEEENDFNSSQSPSSEQVNAMSPTPSEILRPEGFIAPESVQQSPESNADDNEDHNGDEGSSPDEPSCEDGDNEDIKKSSPESADECPKENVNGDTDKESDSNRNNEQETNSDSGVECEKDGFSGFADFDSNDNSMPLPPSNPMEGTLTILAPSEVNNTVANALNNSVNGSLQSEPPDAVPEAFSGLGGLANEGNNEVREGLTVLSPAELGASSNTNSVNMLQNLDLNVQSNNSLSMMRGYIDQSNSDSMEYMPLDRLACETCEVCGERAPDRASMEQHKSSVGHYKCHMSPDCAVVLFGSATELSNHQQTAHGAPPPPPVQQLAQQVQRLPVPYGGQQATTPPQSGSPGYPAQRGSPLYRVPPAVPMYSQGQGNQPQFPDNQPPFQGGQGMLQGPQQIRGGVTVTPSVRMQKRSSMSPTVDRLSPNNKQRRLDDVDCHVIGVQKRADGSVMQGGNNMLQLPESITLSVRGSQQQQQQQPPGKKSDANAVANILATRGITVTPAGGGGRNNTPQNISPASRRTQQAQPQTVVPQPVTTLNLNSAISIIPAGANIQTGRQNQFAVPQGRSVGRQPAQVERPSRPPTVDLTQDTPPVFNNRVRNRMSRFTCQVCDKIFTSQETLNQHMLTHRSPGKLPYRCTLCNAQYPTQQGLLQHKQTYHKETPGSEMALPVIDMKQPGIVQRLTALGIRHFVPLSQLGNQAGGVFGVPIVAIDNARNPAICNLGALGASNVLSLGPVKALR